MTVKREQFCGCADGTSEGPSVNFADFIEDLIEDNDLILDGQEVNEVNCSGGVIFFYEVTVAFEKDPNTLTEVEVTTFEQLFVAECNELSVRLCDPKNFSSFVQNWFSATAAGESLKMILLPTSSFP